ncbi:acetylxylan esterase [Schaalia suimastitidis]|uniref:acetylxylan esterase n=1 Tax=Schaalia suimastitidis TaxID=121163 RepID=UPI00040ECA9D|nr:acetylxylan esterase [Schaalia suimastitidis]
MPRFDMELSELENYRPVVTEPHDLDEFWAATLAENPFDANAISVVEAEHPLVTVKVWDVTFPGYAGDAVRAWLTVPANATEPLPAVVQYNGYGGGRGLSHEHLEWASAGFAHLFMDTRGQGGTWGSGGDTADPHGGGSADQGYMTRGIEDPHTHYYRRLYVDAHHCVEAAANLPQVDASRIAVQGISQGGALTIAAAALNHRVIAAMPDVPFMCHFERAVGMTDAFPYQEIVRYLSVFRGREQQVLSTLSYFDGVLLGARAAAPALFSTALLDTVCPPSTVFAARNWWASRSGVQMERPQIRVYPHNGHEGGQGYQWREQVAWLKDLLAQ